MQLLLEGDTWKKEALIPKKQELVKSNFKILPFSFSK